MDDRPPWRAAGGFSALELLVTISVGAILTVVAVPALSAMLTQNRLATQTNALIGALNYARSEAVTRASAVALCPYTENATKTAPKERYSCAESTDWSGGWIVYRDLVDGGGTTTGEREILRVFAPLSTGDALNGSTKRIQYTASGFLSDAAAPRFSLRPARCQQQQQRLISVSLQGRAHASTSGC